jgi:Tetratricopeptide repeat
MHRLVQDVTLAHLSDTDRQQRTADATGLLSALFPWEGNQPAAWPVCAQLLTHAQALLEHAHAAQLRSPSVAGLMARTAFYLWGRGLDLRLAMELDEQALAMRQRLYQGDHHSVATSLSHLAVDLRALGEPGRARELDEQALAMLQRLYQGDRPDVARSLSHLAVDLRALGEPGRARELDELALAMRQRLFEGDHPGVATSLGNLAVDLTALGEPERARELDEQALAMRQRLRRS